MKLETGKYYRTRDGRKVGPIGDMEEWGGFFCETTGMAYCPDGTHGDACDFLEPCIRNRPENDIIAEWTDEPAKPTPTISGETIDAIAIDSLKWHFKDQDMEPMQLEAFRIVLRYYGVTV